MSLWALHAHIFIPLFLVPQKSVASYKHDLGGGEENDGKQKEKGTGKLAFERANWAQIVF